MNTTTDFTDPFCRHILRESHKYSVGSKIFSAGGSSLSAPDAVSLECVYGPGKGRVIVLTGDEFDTCCREAGGYEKFLAKLSGIKGNVSGIKGNVFEVIDGREIF